MNQPGTKQKILKIMGISNSLDFSPFTTFSLGTILGATCVYYFLKMRRKCDIPMADEYSEKYEFPDPHNEYRLIMGIRNDLKMQKGKVAAQCGHAAVAAYAKALKHKPQTVKRWLSYGGTKITVRIDSEEELLELDKKAKSAGILSSIIRDAGQTQVAPGTRTVIAVGPAPKSELDKVTGHLKLY
ncbi:peptidyl-tRNA hydrolase 2, mitochondrial-like [Agrilus planipennis]|uniref:peptidyl-tRNA hydrolase n=1 Tax=Agrilus planipennis TaxID=224129 RepID=A0A7F5RE12_AGRPL|nr:peptidyl-tRNA hydrolase 2, mitochondrial-like [Agrilus planipennis]XP_025834170.1 peptidyl-tRNA hydrolase 2, mitochondrial-like [Agrilus planipennis]